VGLQLGVKSCGSAPSFREGLGVFEQDQFLPPINHGPDVEWRLEVASLLTSALFNLFGV
jgi:hypothetical protein